MSRFPRATWLAASEKNELANSPAPANGKSGEAKRLASEERLEKLRRDSFAGWLLPAIVASLHYGAAPNHHGQHSPFIGLPYVEVLQLSHSDGKGTR